MRRTLLAVLAALLLLAVCAACRDGPPTAPSTETSGETEPARSGPVETPTPVHTVLEGALVRTLAQGIEDPSLRDRMTRAVGAAVAAARRGDATALRAALEEARGELDRPAERPDPIVEAALRFLLEDGTFEPQAPTHRSPQP